MRKENLYLKTSLRVEKDKDKQPEQGRGRMGTGFAKMITQPPQPSLFDDAAVRAINEEDYRDLLALRKTDLQFGINRDNRPVVLDPKEEDILFALSYFVTQDMDAPDIKAKIANIDADVRVTRTFSIGQISRLLYKTQREREKRGIIEKLQRLSQINQVQIIERNGRMRALYRPLIVYHGFDLAIYDENTPEEKRGDDYVEITLGKAFFHELDKNFFYLTPEIFEEIRLRVNQFDLYRTLLKTLLRASRYGRLRAEEKARAAENEAIRRKVSDDERASMIADAKREGLAYTINVETVWQITTTRYDSSREMKIQFWKDLDKAVASFQRLGLLSTPGYHVDKGKKGQKKITFHLAEDYADGGRILLKPKRAKRRSKKAKATK